MPWGISDDEMDQALQDLFGSAPDGDGAQAAPIQPQPTPSELGITAGILSDVPAHLQVPPTDWPGMDPNFSGIPGAAGRLPQLQSQPINLQDAVRNFQNAKANDTAETSGGLLGTARSIYHSLAGAITSPDFTDPLKRQSEYLRRAGDTVGLGGTGVAVAGTVTAQPELVVPGLAGMGLGEALAALGSAGVAVSDALANNRKAAIRDSIGGLVGSQLPYTVDPQPIVNGTAKYFGF